MDFQEIPTIEDSDTYLDMAFSKAKKKGKELEQSLRKIDRGDRKKRSSTVKIEFVREFLNEKLKKVILGFPNLDNLSEFYKELIKATLNYDQLKNSLGSLKWGLQKIREIGYYHSMKLQNADSYEACATVIKGYYGRVSSIMDQVDDDLKYLMKARKQFLEFPAIKKGLFTVCLSGFPNVGKTTLLNKMTGSSAEVNSYAFTTKKLNMGYFKYNYQRVQVIDTPGTLARFDKMNTIEKQAELAIKYQADYIVFLFDLSDASYSLEKQMRLFEKIHKYDKEIIVYISKVDIVAEDDVSKLKEDLGDDYDYYTDASSLKTELGEIGFNRISF